MSKHTPGKWWNDGLSILCESGSLTEGNRGLSHIADVTNRNFKRPPSNEELANARLIAEAPAMLEALKEMIGVAFLDDWETATTGRQIIFRDAKAIIARAEGKE